MRSPAARWAALAVVLAAGTGCSRMGGTDFDWAGPGRLQTGAAMRVLWTQRLTPEFDGPFMPVERSSAALDPAHDRVYIGSTEGLVHALTSSGREVWAYRVDEAIYAPVALDAKKGELYVGADDGSLHALKAGDGSRRWKDGAGDAIRVRPVLTDDAVYVVTDADRVVAFARKDGTLLWDYARELPQGFSVAGRAGLLLAQGELVTGFTDGTIVALDPSDGTVLWERDTSLDLPEANGAQPVFRDADATPILVGDTLYAASFSAGLYALDPRSGTVRWRDGEITGVVGLAADRGLLVISSADRGVMALGMADRGVRWRRPIERGSPTTPIVRSGLVFVGATDGSLVALTLDGGKEVGRIDSGQGFNATASIVPPRGFILSNGGTLFAFYL